MLKGKYKWLKKENHSNNIIDIILENRGLISGLDKQLFLNPRLENMHDPMRLCDMQKAVDRLVSAKASREKIMIYGDYDVDGITSTSILWMFLKDNGYNVDYYVPNRLNEGYGFNIEAIDRIKERGTNLIISVDTGIAAVNETKYIHEIGMEVIITDHHECQDLLPEAYAIINPKRPECNYPFKELAGVGVTFKLIHALAIRLNCVDMIWKYLDIVTIGTIADIVPLVDENRIIVKHSLPQILSTWNMGLSALIEVTGNKTGKISAGTIGFQIAPRLNASGRLGDAEKGVELFITKDSNRAKQIAEELNDENKKRQDIEQEIYNLAVQQIESSEEIKGQKIIVVAGEGWHNGVVGIVSSRLTEKYYKPSIVLCIKDGKATGSARSISGFSIFEALCDASSFLERFGGHDMAAGLSLDVADIEDFKIHINEYTDKVMSEETLIPKIKIDLELKDEDINLGTLEELENLEPHGMGNPAPVFSYNAKVYNSQAIGADGKHLKMKLLSSGSFTDAIGFNMGEDNRVISKDERVEVAVALQKNEWQGRVTLQLVLKDIKSPEEEITKSEYYLSLYKKFPSLTVENYHKAFTNEGGICYINSCVELQNIVPSRQDCIALYRYIKQLYIDKIDSTSIQLLKKELNLEKMTEYKILQICDIFDELGLIKYEYDDNEDSIRFEIVEGIKSDLGNSKRFVNLMRVEESFKSKNK